MEFTTLDKLVVGRKVRVADDNGNYRDGTAVQVFPAMFGNGDGFEICIEFAPLDRAIYKAEDVEFYVLSTSDRLKTV